MVSALQMYSSAILFGTK